MSTSQTVRPVGWLTDKVRDLDVPDDETVFGLVFGGIADDERDNPAITDVATGQTLTLGEFRDRVEALAGALAARGVGVGDVVGLQAPNGIAYALAFHGIMRAGATITPIGALATAKDVEFQLRDSSTGSLLYIEKLGPAGAEGAERAGVSMTVALDDPTEGLEALLTEGRPAPVIDIDPLTHLAALPYSSGTTGRPKGVRLSHHNLTSNIRQTVAMLSLNGLRPGWTVMGPLPFFHIYGMNSMLNTIVAARCHLLTMPKFDLHLFLEAHQKYGVQYTYVAPPIMVGLAKHPAVDEFDLSSLEFMLSGAAPLDEELADAVAKRIDCDVIQDYGMTETSPLATAHVRGRGDIGSIGTPAPNTEAKLVDLLDPDLAEIPVPEPGDQQAEGVPEGHPRDGELWIRGPQVMLGYHDNEEATAGALTPDGWLRTGDIARYNANGRLLIVDRAKELIKYKGYQVAPAELEAMLLTHHSVADSAVVPWRRPEDGEEVPRAFIVVKEGHELGEEELKDWVAERVAPYKKIRRIDFIGKIPKSVSGKILRRELRDR